jgi:hypothetical protein
MDSSFPLLLQTRSFSGSTVHAAEISLELGLQPGLDGEIASDDHDKNKDALDQELHGLEVEKEKGTTVALLIGCRRCETVRLNSLGDCKY